MTNKMWWVLDGDFRVGPCDQTGVERWYEFIVARGGIPSTEVYTEAA